MRVLQEGEGLIEYAVSLETGGGVAVVQTAVVDGHDLVSGLQELRVDGSCDSVLRTERSGTQSCGGTHTEMI